MLETGDAHQLESWYEYAMHFEPFGDDWQRESCAAARLANVVKQEANAFKPKTPLNRRNLFKDDFLVPKPRKRGPTKKQNRAAALERLEGLVGLNGS